MISQLNLFHGTHSDNIPLIKKEGFKPSECSDYGTAVYFSDKKDCALEYAHKTGEVIEVLFKGKILDLSNPDHFEIYRKSGNAITNGFDALKDGNIIAVYNLQTINITS